MADGRQEEFFVMIQNLPKKLRAFRELLLANAILLSEIPSPTFGELERAQFIEQRFTECGLQHCSVDQKNNCFGIIPGTEGKKTIMVSAHIDTPFAATHNHTCRVDVGTIHCPGIADNSFGAALLTTLPTILERLNIRFRNDLLLIGCAASLDYGNLEGIRSFLNGFSGPIGFGLVVEGTPLGRLQFRSMASMGGVISCRVDRKVSPFSAIAILNQIITKIQDLQDNQGRTSLVLGAVSGGVTYKIPARQAQLKLQVRGDSDQAVIAMVEKIENILHEVSRSVGVLADLEVIARTGAGGVDFAHPLVTHARQVMNALDIDPFDDYYSATISSYVKHDIAALCVGLTRGDNINYQDEYVEIGPMLQGVAQVIALLMGADGEVE